MSSFGDTGVALVSEIEWPERSSGMAVGGFHAHADLFDGGTATACGSFAAASQASQPALAVWPSKSK